MLAELQAVYQSKLPALYYEQYDLSYWVGYAVAEGATVLGNGFETLRDLPKSSQQSTLVTP